MTRHLPSRVRALQRQLRSVETLGASGWKQTFLVDAEARGLAFANLRLREFEPTGAWVWVLDDDDLCVCPTLVEHVATQPARVELVIVRFDHGPLGVLPSIGPGWGQTLPPMSCIGSSGVLVRADLWRRARHAWGPEYEGDYGFVAEAWAQAQRRAWLPIIAGRVQRISKGSPEDIV